MYSATNVAQSGTQVKAQVRHNGAFSVQLSAHQRDFGGEIVVM